MRDRRPTLILNLIASVLLVGSAAIAGCQAPASSAQSIAVVTTTTVFADMVRNVGGDLLTVSSLVPKNGDVHTFAPRPSDVQTLSRASLVVMNGLGLDDWLEKTLTNVSGGKAQLLKLAVDLPGVTLLPGEDPGTQNPHLFMDVRYTKVYVQRIRDALKRIDSGHAARYDANAASYLSRLDALDAYVRRQVARIPEANRRLVTFHDAFPYYAREYGITIVGVAVPAPGQDPSAGYTAQLVDAIRAAHVKVIFSESQFPTRLVDQLASETGVMVVADLYDDSVGDPPVTTYEGIIRWDTDQLVAALR
jgi:ABC-type Zn uptake system ZnuABC Zn-binding protein ZnuA